MIYGKNSPNTVPEQKERESQTVLMPPSQRHSRIIALARRKSPFCHVNPRNNFHATKGFRRVSGKRFAA